MITITAQEAKIQTQDNIDDFITKKMLKLEGYISDAIKIGQFSTTIDGTLEPYIKSQLESLGYKVNPSQYNESYYIISWE